MGEWILLEQKKIICKGKLLLSSMGEMVDCAEDFNKKNKEVLVIVSLDKMYIPINTNRQSYRDIKRDNAQKKEISEPEEVKFFFEDLKIFLRSCASEIK